MNSANLHLDEPARYRICAQGRFEARWLEMLSGVWVISDGRTGCNGVTTLVGCVADQAALMGVLEALYSLGYPILSVEHLADNDKITR